jgi:hypothetical protein
MLVHGSDTRIIAMEVGVLSKLIVVSDENVCNASTTGYKQYLEEV